MILLESLLQNDEYKNHCNQRSQVSNIVFGDIIYMQQRIKYDHHDGVIAMSMSVKFTQYNM